MMMMMMPRVAHDARRWERDSEPWCLWRVAGWAWFVESTTASLERLWGVFECIQDMQVDARGLWLPEREGGRTETVKTGS